MVAKKKSRYGVQTLSVLCGVYTTSVALGFVHSGWDTGRSEFIQTRVTYDAGNYTTWELDERFGKVHLVWKLFLWNVKGDTIITF